jgi:hypothetical protein
LPQAPTNANAHSQKTFSAQARHERPSWADFSHGFAHGPINCPSAVSAQANLTDWARMSKCAMKNDAKTVERIRNVVPTMATSRKSKSMQQPAITK